MADASKPFVYFEEAQLEALIKDETVAGQLGSDFKHILVSFMTCVMQDHTYDDFVKIAIDYFQRWEISDVEGTAKYLADKLVFDPSIPYEYREA